MIKSRKQKPKSAEWTLAMFMELWQRRAWKQAASYCLPSWANRHTTPSNALKHMLNSTLVDVDILQMDANTGVMAAFILVLKVSPFKTNRVVNITRKARLFKEQKRWGIDPECFVKLFM